MVKYLKDEVMVVFEEVPDRTSLAIEITNCQNRCKGCHSPYLCGNIGDELTPDILDKLIRYNDGIDCVLFMGEGNDKEGLLNLVSYVRDKYSDLYIAIYSGRDSVEDIFYEKFDYVKVGRYDETAGPLNSRTTNQRMYKITDGIREDITHRFWRV